MIQYALACDTDHHFDSWFQSSAAFDTLVGAGHVTCPVCGSAKVAKSLMAPAVRVSKTALTTPEGERETALAALRAKVEASSDYVGMNFVAEARAMHDGEAPERSIYGEARADEAIKLLEDGIPVAPLPFMPTRKAN
jgi:hypothetical protein